VRGFTRVATSLTTAPTGFADEVPPFDPLKLVADSRNAPADIPDAGPLQDSAEVSFSMRDLTGVETPLSTAKLSIEEVQAQITEHLKSSIGTGPRAPLPLPSQILLMRTTRAGLDPTGGLGYAPLNSGIIAAPFSSIEVRMVPENVTNIPKTTMSDDNKSRDQRLVVVRHGEAIEDILRAQGATRDQIRLIVAALNPRRGQPAVTEGQRIKFLLTDGATPDQPQQIARVSIYNDDKIGTTIAMADDGSFARVEGTQPAPAPVAKKPAADDDEDEDAGGMRLYDSLFETALKNELPRPIINDLVRIFANDVDFQRAVAAGDSIEAFYTEPDDTDGRNELLFASITTRGETFKYYRFQTLDDLQVDYYDESGKSSRKFLVRQPIAAARITSGFGGRFHPILGYTRMHTGVDFAAPMGTPIFAAGNGTIIKAGRESGYGNRVEIQHANGYITTYNHMSGFARGIAEGARAKQGQVVGYLGMTGLATGPHLHYEVIVNGHFVDPMRVKLARTRELDGRAIASFKRERERIDGLIAKAPGATRVAASRTLPSN
jgi:murein DD-endopeptidase MepM/ murein hydrolase activator NlpD